MRPTACRFCWHDVTLHDPIHGCSCCTCMAHPSEAAPRSLAELAREVIRPQDIRPGRRFTRWEPDRTEEVNRRLTEARQVLLEFAIGQRTHLNLGRCPEPGYLPHSRDPGCFVCTAIVVIEESSR